MSSSRFPVVAIVAIVFLASCYAGREDLRLGIAVALVGLVVSYRRAVLGIPASVAAAAVAVHAPALAAGLIVLAAVAAPFALLLGFAATSPGLAMSRADPADAMSASYPGNVATGGPDGGNGGADC